MCDRRLSPDRSLRQAGLTLLELMLVVGLIAILTAIAVPGFTQYAERSRAAQAARDIAPRIDAMVANPAELQQAIQRSLDRGLVGYYPFDETAPIIDIGYQTSREVLAAWLSTGGHRA